MKKIYHKILIKKVIVYKKEIKTISQNTKIYFLIILICFINVF